MATAKTGRMAKMDTTMAKKTKEVMANSSKINTMWSAIKINLIHIGD